MDTQEEKENALYDLLVAIQDNNYQQVQEKIKELKNIGGDINAIDDNFGVTSLIKSVILDWPMPQRLQFQTKII